MALTFKHATGYHGIAAIGLPLSSNSSTGGNGSLSDSGSEYQKLLCTGGSITINQEPISSTGVWGANSYTASQIAYAYNYLRLEGQANYEITTGLWDSLKSFAITNKTSTVGTKVVLRPDGEHGFAGSGWCNQISFECSEGAALTGSFSMIGDPSGSNSITTGEAEDKFAAANFGENDASSLAGATLVPYYCTGASVGTTSGQEIISWNTSCSTDMQLLKLCKGETSVPLAADYIVCGEITCDGSITVFQLMGDFAPESYHKAKSASFFYYEPTNIVEWSDASGSGGGGTGGGGSGSGSGEFSNGREIYIPKVLYSTGSTSMTTGSSYVQADFNFTGYGNGLNPYGSGSESGGSGSSSTIDEEAGIFIMRDYTGSNSSLS